MAIGRTWWCLLFSSGTVVWSSVATGHRRLCPLTVAAAPCAGCAADHDAQFAELGVIDRRGLHSAARGRVLFSSGTVATGHR
jgi:hypothetical protein